MFPTPQLLNQVANFIQEQGKFSYFCLFLLGKEAGLRVSEAVNFDLNLKKKDTLLKLLTTDLKQQQTLTQLDNNKQEKNHELHQQLIAQIEIKLK